MWLLVVDRVRRQYRWPVLSGGAVAGVLWFVMTVLAEDASSAFAVSIAAAFVIGPMMTAASGTPVVRYLPVSSREVWNAAWVVGTIVTTAALTLIKLPAALAMLVAGDAAFRTIALSGLYDFIAAAAGCALMLRPRLQRLTVAGAIVGPLALWTLHLHLPTQWSHLSATDAAVLVAILAVTAATFASPPRTAARIRPARQIRGAADYRKTAVSGVPQLLVHEFVWTVTMALTLGLMFGLIAFAGGVLMGERPSSLVEFLRVQHLLIFDGASPPMVRSGPTGLLIWFAFLSASLGARFPELLRHLRVLPIGQSSLIALLVAWPAAIWIAVWAGLLVLHASAESEARNLHPDLWLRLVALSALTQSAGLWLKGRYRWIFHAWPAAFLPLVPLVTRAPASIAVPLAIAALAGAVAITRAALGKNITYMHLPVAEAHPGT